MVKATIPLGRIAGVRIGVHWSALITVGLFTWMLGGALADEYGGSVGTWTVAVAGASALFGSLLAHELAHSVIARRNGVQVEGIVLWLLGGVSELRDEAPNPGADLRIAAAGPLVSVGLAAVCLGGAVVAAVAGGDLLGSTLLWLTAMNIVLALFNSIPAAPLDGGRVLRALVWRATGDRLRAETVAARGGRWCGGGLLALGAAELLVIGNAGGLWLILLGWFLFTAANAELTLAGLRHRLGELRVRDVMTVDPVTVSATWSVVEFLSSPAADSAHQVFPVVDADGRPVAVLSWSDVLRMPEVSGGPASVRAIARPLPSGSLVGEDVLLRDVVSRAVLRPNLDLLAAIGPDGRLTGMMTSTDLTTTCQRTALGLRPRPSGRSVEHRSGTR
ncbi:site-2 protease family protein [Nocardia bovistercoris]|uniref:Zinc metalloprotease n=1 Tax=Nocardia bovistercoris TaxID=2785916 RepID=A0A931IJF4_9NOCA|nr:site-2 protease family protein [Nocardia bovistercoris]MBH0781723.1 CBS domain-containing protein [Nocardia bovistercoris]